MHVGLEVGLNEGSMEIEGSNVGSDVGSTVVGDMDTAGAAEGFRVVVEIIGKTFTNKNNTTTLNICLFFKQFI